MNFNIYLYNNHLEYEIDGVLGAVNFNIDSLLTTSKDKVEQQINKLNFSTDVSNLSVCDVMPKAELIVTYNIEVPECNLQDQSNTIQRMQCYAILSTLDSLKTTHPELFI